MRIAFVSYECPPDTAFGGIATYVLQAATALAARGHEVEIFTASPTRTTREQVDGVMVHRIRHTVAETFRGAIAPVFAERHRQVGFEVVEGPEYGADAADVVRLVPDIPLVVRLHTPSYLSRRFSAPPASPLRNLRARVGAFVRGQYPEDSPFHPRNVQELTHATGADALVSPSNSLAEVVARDWRLPRHRIRVIPNVYVPRQELLTIRPGSPGRLVQFIGRLEIQKGVLDLAAAIPEVLRAVPEARFRLVGRATSSPTVGVPMDEYIRAKLGAVIDRVEIVGSVTPQRIPELFGDVRVCVYPSLHENFPMVGLEAMSAARAIIGTRGTGFVEQLADGQAGWLVPPGSPRALALAIVHALSAPDECRRLGIMARERLLSCYSADAICPLQEAGYRDAIAHRAALGPRTR